jgi:hypothetical protein
VPSHGFEVLPVCLRKRRDIDPVFVVGELGAQLGDEGGIRIGGSAPQLMVHMDHM